jgi:biopolymer transport protein ExbB/TolQ
MSVISALVVVAGASIDMIAIWHFLRGRNETSPARIRSISSRAKMLAAAALLVGLVAPVAGVAFAFNSVESVAPEQRAVALAERISEAMNDAILGTSFAVPSLIIALLLMGRSRAIQRQSAATEPGLGPSS